MLTHEDDRWALSKKRTQVITAILKNTVKHPQVILGHNYKTKLNNRIVWKHSCLNTLSAAKIFTLDWRSGMRKAAREAGNYKIICSFFWQISINFLPISKCIHVFYIWNLAQKNTVIKNFFFEDPLCNFGKYSIFLGIDFFGIWERWNN